MNKNYLTTRLCLGAKLANLNSRSDFFQPIVIEPPVRPPLVRVLTMANYYVELLFVGIHGCVCNLVKG